MTRLFSWSTVFWQEQQCPGDATSVASEELGVRGSTCGGVPGDVSGVAATTSVTHSDAVAGSGILQEANLLQAVCEARLHENKLEQERGRATTYGSE